MTPAVAQLRAFLARVGPEYPYVTAVDGLVEENAQLRRALADALATIEAADVGECPVCGGDEPCVGECFEPELAVEADDVPW